MFETLPGTLADTTRGRGRALLAALTLHAAAVFSLVAVSLSSVAALDPPAPNCHVVILQPQSIAVPEAPPTLVRTRSQPPPTKPVAATVAKVPTVVQPTTVVALQVAAPTAPVVPATATVAGPTLEVDVASIGEPGDPNAPEGVGGGGTGKRIGGGDESGPDDTVHRIGGSIVPPRASHEVAPAYPRVALLSRIQGDVEVEAIINEDGRVIDARVVSGPVMLRAAALDAARQWSFVPARLNGRPVKVYFTLTVHFMLR